MKRFRVVLALLVLTAPAVLSACGSLPMPEPTSTPEPTVTPAPTATPSPTDTPEPKPIVGNYFTPYQNNPVLTKGAPGSWDAETVFSSYVTFHDGLYHMFFNGIASPGLDTMAIGYATSADGRSFTKHASNPILTGDESGFDARRVGYGVPLLEEGTWILYYNAGGTERGLGKTIGRATAPAPSGPWARRQQPVLVAGGSGEWDSLSIVPESVVATEEGYAMYYSGEYGYYDEDGRPVGVIMIGMATSPDGIAWTKYDDPATTDPPFAESDPVLQPGPPDSWDSAMVWECAVRRVTGGWEMFYTGSNQQRVQIGYATSSDGFHFTKHRENPIFVPEIDPLATETEPPLLEAPSVVVNDSTYTLYYDYGLIPGGIGLATGTIPR